MLSLPPYSALVSTEAYIACHHFYSTSTNIDGNGYNDSASLLNFDRELWVNGRGIAAISIITAFHLCLVTRSKLFAM